MPPSAFITGCVPAAQATTRQALPRQRRLTVRLVQGRLSIVSGRAHACIGGRPIVIANFSTVRPSGFTKNIRWDDLQLHSERSRSQYGQVSWKQPGSGSPTALGAPGGVSWSTRFTSATFPSFRTMCTSPASSKKVPPAGITRRVQPSAS
jgi:hypothetical protein